MSDTKEKENVLSSLVIRNILLLLAGAMFLLWPHGSPLLASPPPIAACAGCACTVAVVNATASCYVTALCIPEENVIASRISSSDMCPNGFPAVYNQATTTGVVGGSGVLFESQAISIGPNVFCHDYRILEGCDNSLTIQGSLNFNAACCTNPPPPPPPPCCGGCTSSTGWTGCGGSPIILDIDGKGFFLTSASNGVTFDISGTGHPSLMGWTASGADNAFLALPGADGLIHNGTQLFGNFTPQPPSATPNGFSALAVYDDPKNGGNGDGIIDARDAVFASLRLWIDANHDGISQPEEIHTLPSLGVNSISLTYKLSERTDQYGNVFRYRAKANPDSTTDVGKAAYDVFFVGLNSTATNAAVLGPNKKVVGVRSLR